MRSVISALGGTGLAQGNCRSCGESRRLLDVSLLCFGCTYEADAWLSLLDSAAECHRLNMDDPTDRARMAVLLTIKNGANHDPR